MKQLDKPDPEQTDNSTETDKVAAKGTGSSVQKEKTKSKGKWLLKLMVFLVVLGGLAAAAYIGWQRLVQYEQNYQASLDELKTLIEQRVTPSQLNQRITPLQQSMGQSDERFLALEQQQQSLLSSTEKLYELYGRDENGWKLAEVEYLLSIAQHKLVLEHDFEGAAKTLNASSELIGMLGDPGLLPVRVQINDEVAQLKTRLRPDLVGMTLTVSRLSRQITHLRPGYQSRDQESKPEIVPPAAETVDHRSYDERLIDFMKSLVTIKSSQPEEMDVEQTAIINVTEKLEDNLKLTRWSLLDRDAHQYQRLMQENVSLFEQYYDLKDAANADFYEALLNLKKSSIKPELPDISGSLRLLKQIQQKREKETQESQQEADNG
ncbi:MAG: uroporphyrinogen-III C-methyltransferase [Gammaproteobacteria bacterium]|nr:uroporphyrinogen-III C-methyltransferase [Gammaproteobacteria bacterium]